MSRPAALLLLLLLALTASAAAEPLAVSAQRVPLDPEQRDRDALGPLAYRGGLALDSDDRRFGGLSGLLVAPDGSGFLAVTDQGSWIAAQLRYDEAGRLADVATASIGPLKGPDGTALRGKARQDAEALTRLPDGSVLVAFERRHRLWRYPARGPLGDPPLAGRPAAWPTPPGLEGLPRNHGLEALATLADGRVLAFLQDRNGAGVFPVYLGDGARWQTLAYPDPGAEAFEPAGAARLPDGDLVVLERSFTLMGGVAVRLMRLSAAGIAVGATLAPQEIAELRQPLTVDNFEAVDAIAGQVGETLIYLLSDDNFSPFQRTLLLLFALAG